MAPTTGPPLHEPQGLLYAQNTETEGSGKLTGRSKGCQEAQEKEIQNVRRASNFSFFMSFKMNEEQDYEIYHKPLKYKQGTITVQTAGTALFICKSDGACGRGYAQAGELGRRSSPGALLGSPPCGMHGRPLQALS